MTFEFGKKIYAQYEVLTVLESIKRTNGIKILQEMVTVSSIQLFYIMEKRNENGKD